MFGSTEIIKSSRCLDNDLSQPLSSDICDTGESQVSCSKDIDRGWAYVVLTASLIAQIIIFGISYSSAIFYVTFLDEFQQSPSTTAWVVTLNTCCTYIFGPLGSALNKYLNARKTIIIGCIVSSVGMISSMFAYNLYFCFISFGVVTGLGWSLVYVSLFGKLAEYFQQYRKLAIATSSTGIALGQFIYPPFLNYLFDKYHWSGGLLILAGVNLNLLVTAAVMMQPRSIAAKQDVQPIPAIHRKASRKLSTVIVVYAVGDLPLLKNVRFFLLIASTLISGLAVSAFLTHITRVARMAGHSELSASLLPSSIGISSLFGRLMLGLFAQHPRVSVLLLNIACFTCVGLSAFFSAFVRVYPGLLAASISFGFFSGVWGLLPEVLVAVVGLHNLTGGLGVLNFFSAIGLLFGGPVAAWLYEADPTYQVSFIISGVCSVLSSCLLIPSFLKNRQRIPRTSLL